MWVIVIVATLLVAGALLWWFLLRGNGWGNGDKQKMKDELYASGPFPNDAAAQKKFASCFVNKLVSSVGMDAAKKIILDGDEPSLEKYCKQQIDVTTSCLRKLKLSIPDWPPKGACPAKSK